MKILYSVIILCLFLIQVNADRIRETETASDEILSIETAGNDLRYFFINITTSLPGGKGGPGFDCEKAGTCRRIGAIEEIEEAGLKPSVILLLILIGILIGAFLFKYHYDTNEKFREKLERTRRINLKDSKKLLAFAKRKKEKIKNRFDKTIKKITEE